MNWTFYIEQLSNGAWQFGWREGHGDYDRLLPTRAGFATYAEAEKYALAMLRDLMRKQRDVWAKAAKNAEHQKRLQSSLAVRQQLQDR